MSEAYSAYAPSVNPENSRRESLRSLDLITTEELLEALRCSRKTLAILREHGLEQLGPGKDCFYRRSAVASALERHARTRKTTPEGMEADDE